MLKRFYQKLVEQQSFHLKTICRQRHDRHHFKQVPRVPTTRQPRSIHTADRTGARGHQPRGQEAVRGDEGLGRGVIRGLCQTLAGNVQRQGRQSGHGHIRRPVVEVVQVWKMRFQI